MSIQLHLFSKIITRFPESKLIYHRGGLVAQHRVPISVHQWASREGLSKWRPLCEAVRVVAITTPSKWSTWEHLLCCDTRPLPLPGALNLIQASFAQRDGGGGSNKKLK